MLLVANWKAYVEDAGKAKQLVALGKRLARTGKVSIVLAPPAPFLSLLAQKNDTVSFAIQDVSATTGGAKTGEITAPTAFAAGATYAIVGHSERRAMGDTNAMVAEKMAHALAHDLTPILCVGEKERDSDGQYLAFIRDEITSALTSLSLKERKKIIIAYEPLWAIGKTADAAIAPHDLAEIVLYIHKILSTFLPGKTATAATILYGGSVEPENAHALALGSGISGFLVGHASVELESFTALVNALG